MSLVGPHIAKQTTPLRETINPSERLVITLRYLASGDSQQSQSFNFRVGQSSVCEIVKETCVGIWNALNTKYLKAPEKSSDWKGISKEFFKEWNFSHCLGALDGKHVMIECPAGGGSDFFNYKGFHSIVLLAICDAKYCFTMVDIGSFGKDNDADIFNQSVIGKGFASGTFDIQEAEKVDDSEELPYVIVADEIFGLKTYLMKPYPGSNLSAGQKNLITDLAGVDELLKMHLAFYRHVGKYFADQPRPKHVMLMVLSKHAFAYTTIYN